MREEKVEGMMEGAVEAFCRCVQKIALYNGGSDKESQVTEILYSVCTSKTPLGVDRNGPEVFGNGMMGKTGMVNSEFQSHGTDG